MYHTEAVPLIYGNKTKSTQTADGIVIVFLNIYIYIQLFSITAGNEMIFCWFSRSFRVLVKQEIQRFLEIRLSVVLFVLMHLGLVLKRLMFSLGFILKKGNF